VTSVANILIVDDDDVIRETLFELLSTNYNCATATTAEEALAKLEDKKVDVLLTDITLPGLSGQDLLTQMQQRFPQTPVIVVSGITDEDQAQKLMTMGAFDYLLKPFRLEVVETSVRRALESRR
jgi:two-component system nitrogen regulation response regulator GlnG